MYVCTVTQVQQKEISSVATILLLHTGLSMGVPKQNKNKHKTMDAAGSSKTQVLIYQSK